MANLNVFQALSKLFLEVRRIIECLELGGTWEASGSCLEIEDRVSKSLGGLFC